MGFEWGRIHKWEENHEREITEEVFDYVCEFFGVDNIFELEKDQVEEIDKFRDNELSEYSVMQIGFSNLMNQLDDPDFYNESDE